MDKPITQKRPINGVSTGQGAERENKGSFQMGTGRKRRLSGQSAYRHTDGELFSCVKPTLDECRRLRDEWIKTKEDRL